MKINTAFRHAIQILRSREPRHPQKTRGLDLGSVDVSPSIIIEYIAYKYALDYIYLCISYTLRLKMLICYPYVHSRV